MRVGILGRVAVWDDHGDEVALRPQVRRLLGLFLTAESSLSVDQIAEYAASGRATGSAVRTAVGRLRSVIGGRIVTAGSGYELVLSAAELDATVFEELLARAVSAEPNERVDLLASALAQWRGPALGELADEPWAAPTAARLNRIRADAVHDHAEALIDVGRWSEAVVLLEPHVMEVPYQERPIALLMRALAGSGRVTEALRCFRRFSVTLRDDVGVGPSRALMELELDLLGEADPRERVGNAAPIAGPACAARVPEPVSSFVGRGDEVKELVEELGSTRLITLTGVGGVGKTRLANRIAGEAAEQFPDGVWFVDLATVTTSDIAVVAATALDVPVDPTSSPTASIVDQFRQRRGLMVIDNCEHVLAPAASLVAALLAGCPSIAIVATSREHLGVDGERVHPVLGLDGLEAHALFCERATEADDRFDPTDGDGVVIDTICCRLDGIPLAIELAAARTRSFTVLDVLERLDDRFHLLRNGRRSADRHGTLEAAIDWSYDLLDDDERSVFERLSVFPGDFDLAAAVAVCMPPETSVDVGEALRSLVDKSMAVADLGGRHARFRLLESVRSYAGTRLNDRGETRSTRRRHRDHFATVARAVLDVSGPNAFNDMAPFAVLRHEWHNLRAAVTWSLDVGEPEAAVQIAMLPPVFYLFLDEHAEWMNSILEQLPDEHRLAGISYGFAAVWCTLRGDNSRAFELAEHGLELDDRLGGVAHRLLWSAVSEARVNTGDPVGGLAAARRSLAAGEARGQTDDELVRPLGLACMCAITGEPDAVEGFADRLAGVAAQAPSEVNITAAANAAGYVLLARGEADAALEAYRQMYALGRGIPHLQGVALKNMAVAASQSALTPRADGSTTFVDALDHVYRGRMWSLVWIVLEALAVFWARSERPLDAAVILGYLDRHGRANGVLLDGRRQALDVLQGVPGADAARTEGAAMTRDDLVEFALGGLSGCA
jgi:predicted ATPase/DNA-binding SARP family transcriptional activator